MKCHEKSYPHKCLNQTKPNQKNKTKQENPRTKPKEMD